jgi:hypothetical protein
MADLHNVSTESVATLIFVKVSGRLDQKKKSANGGDFGGMPYEEFWGNTG